VSESALTLAPRALFGVADSVTGRAWVERCDPGSALIGTAIAQTHGLPDHLARVLAGRGVAVAAVPAFLEPRLRDLMPDPSTLTGMDEAVARLAGAVLAREQVAIFGDYDVDGACSAALLSDYLEAAGCPVTIHIPDRITEGYGPNSEAMRRFAQDGARLVVTVDCGTAGHEPIAEAAGSASTSSCSTTMARRNGSRPRPRSSTRTGRTTCPGSATSPRPASSS
jgi:single-stranded-DNA-specific exonuclease